MMASLPAHAVDVQNALSKAFEPLPGRQQMTAILLAAGILLLVLELVRRRKLREE